MKKSLLVLFMIVIFGCSYGQDYLKNPTSFIRDPHFTEYKNTRDDLESSYLSKEITYAEYIEQKDKIDEKYSKEVQERNSKIISQE